MLIGISSVTGLWSVITPDLCNPYYHRTRTYYRRYGISILILFMGMIDINTISPNHRDLKYTLLFTRLRRWGTLL
jgi:hypothetical protein